MFKLLTSIRGGHDLSIRFDGDLGRRKDKLRKNKNIKRKYRLRNMPKDVFGFRERQKKVAAGLGYKLTLKRNKDEAVIDKLPGIAEPKTKIDHFLWYAPH